MKKHKKISGYILILVAVVILVRLPNMVYPIPDDDGMDTNLYILGTVLNIARYVVLSIFSFVLGTKLAFKH